MEYRRLGTTDLKLSALGFGCGAIGGLLVRGNHGDMVRVIGRAIELGITYFDTARIYGDGLSEANLGRVLEELGADVLVGTKVRLREAEMDSIGEAVHESVEGSLRRLRRERVDLIQLHSGLGIDRHPGSDVLRIDDLDAVIDAFQTLEEQGKARYWGINGLGETPALHKAVAKAAAHSIQCCHNPLNPSAGMQMHEGFSFQDYRQLIDRAAENRMGVIGIRVLAGGALSGSMERHPNAAQSVVPIATSRDLAGDVRRSRRFGFLVDDGYSSSLVEASIRFAIGKPELSTALAGVSSMDQLEQAVAAANKGPLAPEAMARLTEVWSDAAS